MPRARWRLSAREEIDMSSVAYHRPTTIAAASTLLRVSKNGKLLAGGQTLVRPVANVLADVSDIIDLGQVRGISGVTVGGGTLSIGAMTTHAAIGTSETVQATIPALASLAIGIGDPAIRHRGTIGGALADNEPAGDYQVACLCFDAEIITDRRQVPAETFFAGRRRTTLSSDEIIVAVRFSVPHRAVYERIPHPTGWGAIAGVMVAHGQAGMRVAVTGAARAGAFRWRAAEEVLARNVDPAASDAALPGEDRMAADHYATSSYRAHLVRNLAKRAISKIDQI
jgi:aerobic carbon-monoxide dehydrogenase medium subunit